MSGRHDTTAVDARRASVHAPAHESGRPTDSGPLTPTWREAVTIGSMPTVLLAVHFLLQPAFDAWPRLGYVRYTVAQTAPAHRLAPEPFTAHAWAWHEFTRVSHSLIHAPGGYHAHVIGNVSLVVMTAWALLVVLTALGHRRWFVFCYWELVVVAPVVGSFAFDLFGTTAHGYGASTVGFAFLGIVAVVSLTVLVRDRRHRHGRPFGTPARPDGGETDSPAVMFVLLCVAAVVIAADVVASSPATPIHQAGVGFGVFVGAVLVSLARWR